MAHWGAYGTWLVVLSTYKGRTGDFPLFKGASWGVWICQMTSPDRLSIPKIFPAEVTATIILCRPKESLTRLFLELLVDDGWTSPSTDWATTPTCNSWLEKRRHTIPNIPAENQILFSNNIILFTFMASNSTHTALEYMYTRSNLCTANAKWTSKPQENHFRNYLQNEKAVKLN